MRQHVFDERIACGVRAYPATNRWNFFRPGEKGYELFAAPRRKRPSRPDGARAEGKSGARKGAERLWARRVPIKVEQRPMTESRRMRELQEFVMFMQAEGGRSAMPGMEWMVDTVVQQMESPVARHNWELQKRRNDAIAQMKQIIQIE